MFEKSRKLVILTYHRVLVEDQRHLLDEIDAEQFRLHVDVFSRYFNVLGLSEAVNLLDSRDLPQRAICITFDDGYRDNVDIALPILAEKRVPATFFVATNYLNGGIMWNDVIRQCMHDAPGDTVDLRSIGLGQYVVRSSRDKIRSSDVLIRKIKYLPQDDRDALCHNVCDFLGVTPSKDLMMSSDDLVRLRDAGMELGGHTRSHPILSVIDDTEARREILGGKKDLEAILGEKVTSFAFPNGRRGEDYEQRHVEMVREAGFRLAVSTAARSVSSASDRFQLGRFSVWHRSRVKLIFRLMLNYFKI